MYDKINVAYVLTCLEAIEKLFLYTDGIDSAEALLQKDEQLVFNACQTLLMVIGEETKKITEDAKEDHATIPWRLIAGMRNRIAHDYRSLNAEISYDVIRNYLPDLKEVLIDILNKTDFPEERLRKILRTSFYKHIRYLLD